MSCGTICARAARTRTGRWLGKRRGRGSAHTPGVIEAADELSAQSALASKAGSADLLYVAAAWRLHLLSGLDEFWPCYAEQGALAAAAGQRR